jgi:hypothetical protein
MRYFIGTLLGFTLGIVVLTSVYNEDSIKQSRAYLAAQAYYLGCYEQTPQHEVCNSKAQKIFDDINK